VDVFDFFFLAFSKDYYKIGTILEI